MSTTFCNAPRRGTPTAAHTEEDGEEEAAVAAAATQDMELEESA